MKRITFLALLALCALLLPSAAYASGAAAGQACASSAASDTWADCESCCSDNFTDSGNMLDPNGYNTCVGYCDRTFSAAQVPFCFFVGTSYICFP